MDQKAGIIVNIKKDQKSGFVDSPPNMGSFWLMASVVEMIYDPNLFFN